MVSRSYFKRAYLLYLCAFCTIASQAFSISESFGGVCKAFKSPIMRFVSDHPCITVMATTVLVAFSVVYYQDCCDRAMREKQLLDEIHNYKLSFSQIPFWTRTEEEQRLAIMKKLLCDNFSNGYAVHNFFTALYTVARAIHSHNPHDRVAQEIIVMYTMQENYIPASDRNLSVEESTVLFYARLLHKALYNLN